MRIRSLPRSALAALSAVVAAAVGVVTNLVTADWSWSLVTALVGLVLAGAVLAVLRTGDTGSTVRRTAVTQVARGGDIVDSVIEAADGATVAERAERHGEIRGGNTAAKGAEVRRTARRGVIQGGKIDAE